MSDITILTDVDLLHPDLRAAWESGEFRTEWHNQMVRMCLQKRWLLRLEPAIFETHRPTAEQVKRYETRRPDGKRTTTCDGVIRWSRHQDLPSTAVDFALKLDGRWTWDTTNPLVRAGYDAIMHAAEALDFQSGGRWKRLRDYPHVQMQGEDRVAEVQRLLNALGYDCGEVDGIHGRRTDGALELFGGVEARDRGASHIKGRIHPDEWTALWAVARDKGVA